MVGRFASWVYHLFVAPWQVQGCGCRFRENSFCPMEFDLCKHHLKEEREWLSKQPPGPPTPVDTNIYFCG